MTKLFTYLSNWKLKYFCAVVALLYVGVGNIQAGWTLCTSASDFVANDYYMFVAQTAVNSKYYYVKAASEARAQGSYSSSTDTLTACVADPTTLALKDAGWKLVAGASSGQWKLQSYLASTIYLYCGSGGNKLGTALISTANSYWTITKHDTQSTFKVMYYGQSRSLTEYTTSPFGIRTYTGDNYIRIYRWSTASCSANPSIGDASLNGSISLSSIPLSVSSVGGGTDCTLAEYGFVWKASSTPSASDNKTKIGESSSATSFTGSITGSFSTGVTYYIKGYAINNGSNTTLSTNALTITPRSVTFNLNGHGSSTPSTQYVNSGSKASDPSYSESVSGWVFGGWFREAECTNEWTFGTDVVSKDTTLYAKWTEKPKYTITLNAGNGTISDANWTNTSGCTYTRTQANGDEEITLPTPSCNCAGWVFQGWSTTSKDNAASFTPDKEDGASFVPAADVTYYAVYRQNTKGGTRYNKITNVSDLTTGDYLFVSSSSYAMKNAVSGTRMEETSGMTSSNSYFDSPAANLVWTIVKFGSQVVIKYGTNFLGIDGSNNICLTTTPHFFTYTYNTTNNRWEFTSATKTTYMLTYSGSPAYFRMATSQSTAIYLYKRGGLSGNYYTSPDCSSLSVTGVADPVAGGSVILSSSAVTSGDSVFAYYTKDEAYIFDEWSFSGTGASISSTSASLIKVIAGSTDITVTANFTARVAIAFKTPDGETTGYADEALPSGSLPEGLSSLCWAFAGWTTETYKDHSGTGAPAVLYEEGDDVSSIITTATDLYAVYKTAEGYKWVKSLDDLEANEYYILTIAGSGGKEYALSNSVTKTYYSAGVDISGRLSENVTDAYIYNPPASVVWKFTGDKDAGRLYNEAGRVYLDLHDDDEVILQESTSDYLKFTKFNTTMFNIASTTTTSNFLYMWVGDYWGVDTDHDGYASAYLYKRQSATRYVTSPSSEAYSITWVVDGDDTYAVGGPTTTTTTCAGIEIMPTSPANNTISDCADTFMGWSETKLTGSGNSKPDDLFISANGAPKIDDNKTFYAIFATEKTSTRGSYTLNYSADVSSETLGYGEFVEVTASDGSSWVVQAYKNSGMQINTGKSSSIQIPDCPDGFYITSIVVTCSSSVAIGFADGNYYGSGTITYVAEGSAATSQTLNLKGKTRSGGYIVPKGGSVVITNIVVNYAEYTDYQTRCCDDPELEFGQARYSLIREDLHGNTSEAYSTIELTYSSESTGEIRVWTKEDETGTSSDNVYTTWQYTGANTWGTSPTTGGTAATASTHAYFEITDAANGKAKFYVKNATANNGRGTYRVALYQAADATHCETVTYCWIDVTLRDKFVDAVNGNTFPNADAHGPGEPAVTTPAESTRDAAKDDDCHETTRRLVGWVKETDMNTWYVTGNSTRVSNLDDKKEDAKLVAPGATITTSGATWYAVWGEEVTE